MDQFGPYWTGMDFFVVVENKFLEEKMFFDGNIIFSEYLVFVLGDLCLLVKACFYIYFKAGSTQ